MMNFKSFLPIAALAIGGTIALTPQVKAASFLDIDDLSTGNPGGFSGTLGGVNVVGSLSGGSDFTISPVGITFENSTIDNSSPQYSYSSVFNPTQPLGDRVGYVMGGATSQTATLTINFGSPVINPVFHVANLDSMTYDFSSTSGITSLSLLNGNGGGGDGLLVSGLVISDANPNTIVGIDPTSPPPTTGQRSAYGSVQLLGTFSSLTIGLARNPSAGAGDGGNFTLSTAPDIPPVPEPTTTLGLLAIGLVGLGSTFRRERSGK